jgi:hypothetical protein
VLRQMPRGNSVKFNRKYSYIAIGRAKPIPISLL